MQAESVEAAVRRHAHRTLDEQRRDIKALVAASRLRIARTQALVLASLVVAAGLLLLVALSPLFLVELDERNEADWSRLSEIGQTYGAASALLSGLALAGVAASLILQARQASTDRMYAIRSMHLELVRMGLDDPRLLGLDPDAPETNDGRRERYLALWLNQARMAYQVGITPEASLRMEVLGDAIFASAIGRRWWNEYGRRTWVAGSRGRADRRFVHIVEEEYRKAEAGDRLGNVASNNAPKSTASNGEKGSYRAVAVALGSLAIGVLLGRSFTRRRR